MEQDEIIKKVHKKTIKKITTVINDYDSFYEDDLFEIIDKYKENMEEDE